MPGTMALLVQDDGHGMRRAQLQNMLSFGFSSKEHVEGNVGRFGIGFKSGSMRLANDALILTRQADTASVALLSTTFLHAINADDILIPMFTWKIETSISGNRTYVAQTPSSTAEWEENMGVLEEYTYLNSEKAVLAELDKITSPTGTRIVLFNLKDPPEFDFETDPLDVRMMAGNLDDDDVGKARTSTRRPVFQQHRPGQQMTLDVPEDYSLRAYMEVLYLRPTVAFTLRGEPIVPRCPIARLKQEYYQFDPYTPRGIPEERASPIIIHCGYLEESSKHCGFHIYNKNRLIRMYQRFGAQLQANTMMKDMLGVVEADCLEPTHNKQAFNTTDIAYAKCQKHIEKSMNDYYFGFQQLRLAGTAGRLKPSIAKRNANKSKKNVKYGKVKTGSNKKASTAKGKRKATNSNEDTDTEEDEVAWDEEEITEQRKSTPKKQRVDPLPKLLRKVSNNKKHSWPFLEPVDAEYWGVDNYYEVIKNPMDFGTISTKLDAGEYKWAENSGHGPLMFVKDVRQVFYNAWTFNAPGQDVYEAAQHLGRIFETELKKVVGDEDKWGLTEGSVIEMCGPLPGIPGAKVEIGGGDVDIGAGVERAIVQVKEGTRVEATTEMDSAAIEAMVEARVAQAVAAANRSRDDALAALREERAAREAFEAELEAQMTVSITRVREEEQERLNQLQGDKGALMSKLEGERDTLMSALEDSKEMKVLLQDKCKAQEQEIASLRQKLAAAEAALRS